MINDILDLSRIEAGRESIVEEEIDPNTAVESCLRLMISRQEEAGVRITVSYENDLPPILVDKRKFTQILMNLTSNALKFTPAGGKVTIHGGSDETDGFWIAVKDTGIGIRPEDIPKALEPFSQIDESHTRTHKGTGLGLPISRALARLMGGDLAIESTVHVGTEVRFSLPASRMVSGAKTEGSPHRDPAIIPAASVRHHVRSSDKHDNPTAQASE